MKKEILENEVIVNISVLQPSLLSKGSIYKQKTLFDIVADNFYTFFIMARKMYT